MEEKVTIIFLLLLNVILPTIDTCTDLRLVTRLFEDNEKLGKDWLFSLRKKYLKWDPSLGVQTFSEANSINP